MRDVGKIKKKMNESIEQFYETLGKTRQMGKQKGRVPKTMTRRTTMRKSSCIERNKRNSSIRRQLSSLDKKII
jgi:hypothetical protein